MANPQKLIAVILLTLLVTGCSEFALLMSGSSIAITQNAYVKAYNGVDMLTIMKTDKDIKKHIYDNAKKAWVETKERKEHLYDKTWGLTD